MRYVESIEQCLASAATIQLALYDKGGDSMGNWLQWVTGPYPLIAVIFVGIIGIARKYRGLVYACFGLAVIIVSAMLGLLFFKIAPPPKIVIDDPSQYIAFEDKDFNFTFRYPRNVFIFKDGGNSGEQKNVSATSTQGHAVISVSETGLTLGESLGQLIDLWKLNCSSTPAPYEIIHDSWIVLSCVEKGSSDVLYRKKILGKHVSILFLMHYPVVEKPYWDDVVTVVEKTLQETSHNN